MNARRVPRGSTPPSWKKFLSSDATSASFRTGGMSFSATGMFWSNCWNVAMTLPSAS